MKTRILPVILLPTLLLARLCAADATVSECVVSGSGADQQAAVLDGLVQAIQQINGVKVEQKSIDQRRYLDAVTDVKETFTASTAAGQDIRTASHGFVDGYEVLEQTREAPGRGVRVRLKVRVPVYDPNSALRAGQRKVIAVLPFRAALPAFRIYGRDYPAERLQKVLSQGLVEGLVQSHKFTVLDRDFLSDLLGEQKLMQAVNMPPQELVRVGQLKGADFLLVGSIDDADAAVETAAGGPGAGGPGPAPRHAKVSVSYRVVNLATGKVHWADSFHRTYNENDLHTLPPEGAGLRVEEILIRDASATIADQVVSGVFPLSVLRIDGPQVILNQGARGMKPDDEYDVFKLGEDLVDPQTHEVLEQAESRLAARVRVARSTTKVTYAQIVSGDLAGLKPEELICRRHVDPSAKYLRRPDAAGAPTAVVVLNANNQFDEQLGRAVSDFLSADGVRASSEFFTAAVVADGFFDRMFGGSWNDVAPLGLSQHCTYIVLARRTSSLAARRKLQDMVTGKGSLDVRVLRAADGECVDQFVVSGDTSGFSPERAEGRLDENLLKELTRHGFGDWRSAAKSPPPRPGN